jgi:hypothetical protein
VYLCAERQFNLLLEVRQRGALDISVDLHNRVTQSHQIATRRFGSATGRVNGKFCLVQP